MTWIIFDEADHYSPAPDFCLPSSQEKMVCLRDYHEECNVVLIFTHDTGCLGCRELLESFARRQEDYVIEEAKILAILPEPVEALQAEPFLSTLPFLLLSDPQESTRKEYAGLMAESLVSANDSILFVLDRYGAPYTALIDRELDSPIIHQEVQSWLAYTAFNARSEGSPNGPSGHRLCNDPTLSSKLTVRRLNQDGAVSENDGRYAAHASV
jgi:peroxiredoxin